MVKRVLSPAKFSLSKLTIKDDSLIRCLQPFELVLALFVECALPEGDSCLQLSVGLATFVRMIRFRTKSRRTKTFLSEENAESCEIVKSRTRQETLDNDLMILGADFGAAHPQ